MTSWAVLQARMRHKVERSRKARNLKAGLDTEVKGVDRTDFHLEDSRTEVTVVKIFKFWGAWMA